MGVSEDTKNTFSVRKNMFLLYKNCLSVKQDRKDVSDLLESIMRPPRLVKEELRRILFKMDQFSPKITKIKV